MWVGANGSEVRLAAPGSVRVTCTATALLPVMPQPIGVVWRWNLEHARLPMRQVPVEIVVNGLPLHRQLITADGREVVIDRTLPIYRSSWIGVRILNSSHTNSIYVIVDGQPIRASKASAEWCTAVVDRYWSQLSGAIRAEEIAAATQAYQSARATYQAIAGEASIGPFAQVASYGSGCAGTNGVPLIGAAGKPFLGNAAFAVTLSRAAPGVVPALLLSLRRASTPIGPCELLLGAPAFPCPVAPATDPTGAAKLSLPIPASPAFEGAELFFQWVIPDPRGTFANRLALSDGLEAHLSAFGG